MRLARCPLALLCGALAFLIPLWVLWTAHTFGRASSAAADSSVLRIVKGHRQFDNGLLPPISAAEPPQEVQLPTSMPPGERRASWILLSFTLDLTPADVWTIRSHFEPSLLVYLDGQLLAQSQPLSLVDRPLTDFHLGGQAISANIPPSWLSAGQHQLQLRVGPVGPSGAMLDVVTVGPAKAMQLTRPTSGLSALRVVTSVTSLVLGALLVMTWLANRRSLIYLFGGAHVLLLALLLSPYLFDQQPLPLPWWRVLLDTADVGAKALLLAIVIMLSRPVSRGWLRICAAYAVIGVLVDGTAAALDWNWIDFEHLWPWWALGSRTLVLGAATLLSWRNVLRQPGLETLITATLTATTALLWAYVSLFVLVVPGRIDVMDVNVVAYAGWAIWVGILLQGNFIRATRRERQLRQESDEALEQRTRDLKASFLELQASEQKRLAAIERELILQEMHDGLGSQLMSAKMNAHAGNLSAGEMATVLDGCIHELRQTMDTLSVTNGDLGLLLANLRRRMQRSFEGAGLRLEWQVAETPLIPALTGAGGRELVRIVQEAFTNVISHASASQVTVRTEMAVDLKGVVLTITDDGIGLGPHISPGHGLHNIRQRCTRLGGHVDWISPLLDSTASLGAGTKMAVWLPL